MTNRLVAAAVGVAATLGAFVVEGVAERILAPTVGVARAFHALAGSC